MRTPALFPIFRLCILRRGRTGRAAQTKDSDAVSVPICLPNTV